MFTELLFTMAKTWEQPKHPSAEERIKKMKHIDTMVYCPVINGQNNAFRSIMDTARDYHTKWTKSENEKHHTVSLLCEAKIWHSKPVYRTESQMQRADLQWTRGRGGGRRMDHEVGVRRCKLLHLGWKTNKVLLYRTGNCIQSPWINRRENVYLCIPESLCCTAEVSTRL